MALSACVALAAAGCGSSSPASPASSSESTAAQEGAAPTTAGETTSQSAGSAPVESGDHSVQEYGSKASGTEASAPSAAMRSFFTAFAAPDYAKVCAGLAAANLEELSQFAKQGGGCPAALKLLNLHAGASEAKAAAAAPIKSVRVKGDTAFIIFTPKGGKPSFFVMKREGGAWKAISLGPGTPLEP